MLNEVPVQRIAGVPPRGWHADGYIDLIDRYQAGGSINGFQLCYEKLKQERALTSKMSRGFSHSVIDARESSPLANRTQILVLDGVFPAELVREEFVRRGEFLDEELRELVLGKIDEYGTTSEAHFG